MRLQKKWQVLFIICLGIFMTTLDGSILNIATPTIARYLHITMEEVQWILTSYLLVITASLIFWGRLGDTIGNHTIYTFGFLFFTAGSFLCSIAHNLLFLIIARIIQAFGGSMMMATGIGVVCNSFPAAEKGRALGLTGTVVGLGNLAGPSLGGILVNYYNWRAIFWLNIPIGLISFVLALKFITPQPISSENHNYDPIGTTLLAMFATLLVLAVVGSTGINMLLILMALAVLFGFYRFEKITLNPLLDFSLFKLPAFVKGNLMGITAYTAHTLVVFLLPFLLEKTLKYSPAYSGLLMTLPPLAMAIVAPLAGYLADKWDTSHLISASFIFLTAAFWFLSHLGPNSGSFDIAIDLVLLGIGLGLFGSPNTSSIMAAVTAEKSGYAGGFIATVRNLSYCLGTAASASIFTLLLNYRTASLGVTSAYTSAACSVFKIAALVSIVGLILSLSPRPTGLTHQNKAL